MNDYTYCQLLENITLLYVDCVTELTDKYLKEHYDEKGNAEEANISF